MTHAPDILRIAVAQLNPTVGDVAGNLAKAREARADAARQGADLVLYTELFLAGYPPEDLVLKPAFLKACEKAAQDFAKDTADGGPGVIIGTPLKRKSGTHNSIVFADSGKIIAERYKLDLPNYGEFDEKRVFQAGPELQGPVNFRGVRIGVPICEDIWGDIAVCETLAESGAEILLVPNGSPYYRAKIDVRHQVVIRQVIETGLPMIYANQLGGQDELIFDGASFAIGADKTLAFQMSQFEEAVAVTTWKRSRVAAGAQNANNSDHWVCSEGPMSKIPEREEADYRACMLGLRDYVNKNGFKNVVLGLSGGIDSAICAALAVDALGEERLRTVMMPYRYTSKDSLKDAEDCARALGCRYDIVPIFEPVEGFRHALTQLFEGTQEGITEENLQSRARGTILMAISNKFGSMVVTTGNKSEMSVGYATLYGDMNGGFNPIKDLYKMQVYALSRWRNSHVPPGALGPSGEVIPKNIIDKAPSAELRENQTDQDSLPPYPVLDDILECLVENEMGVDDIVARGHDRATVARVEHLLYIAEYKRRQAAPGVKITRKNFGRDRRYPITNRFRDRG
ncbi:MULTISPECIES: NAD+ synthase [unclassified Mesorhizobium]|uniref:NAD+ synthase n=1 Tax=unclassified Mesorhizobium TaxID=325217 RepID=UPI000F756808|nr:MULTISPECIES: NAD+ synthase [unclassified Mesorhizobium]AZO23381.1 NAD+ synthase [Mesorhizobium sp. M1E.F.Ca.ET.045.02.1.1]RUW30654.1 NAD+ synthase [Mesorhizobium sp. M1E.F.Ca.ET.041.01.1.1]RUW82227.1 NAD+ synthase [Mesorhizobium sp. M1E.F.Ca.ET.063.01.1.1]RWD88438.1 MAG: NAD+ synthase [Mesorhizobium sp.]RWD94380.1 MAG: NAD+ synthase [Mesorhizobium sp.]